MSNIFTCCLANSMTVLLKQTKNYFIPLSLKSIWQARIEFAQFHMIFIKIEEYLSLKFSASIKCTNYKFEQKRNVNLR